MRSESRADKGLWFAPGSIPSARQLCASERQIPAVSGGFQRGVFRLVKRKTARLATPGECG
jgi:hypothetical protein